VVLFLVVTVLVESLIVVASLIVEGGCLYNNMVGFRC